VLYPEEKERGPPKKWTLCHKTDLKAGKGGQNSSQISKKVGVGTEKLKKEGRETFTYCYPAEFTTGRGSSWAKSRLRKGEGNDR